MSLSLRQKKSFKTKNALAQAFVDKLAIQKFEEISIKDVCEQIELSEATFFNYFPQKIDVIYYFLKLRMFKTFCDLKALPETFSLMEKIEKAFELFSSGIKHPYAFFEVISIIGTKKMHLGSYTISSEEIEYHFPDYKLAEPYSMKTLKDYFEELITEAIEKKQISETICKKNIVHFLMTILKGVPLSTPISEFSNLTQIYKNHLSILWKILQK